MKKVFYLLTISLVAALSAAAQNQLLPRVSFGLKGGANVLNFTSDNIMSSESRGGFQVGVLSRIALGAIHLQPELYYMQKSARVTKAIGNVVNDVTFKSIDLPILLGYSWGGDMVNGRIVTGPLISFSTGDKQSPGTATNGAGLIYNDQNYAWVIGTGIDVNKVSFDLRYEYGLNRLQNTELSSRIRPSVFSLSVSYRFLSL